MYGAVPAALRRRVMCLQSPCPCSEQFAALLRRREDKPMLPAVPLQARAYGNACNAKPAVFHVPAADPMTGPDAFRGQALHRRLLRPVRRAAENLLLAPQKSPGGGGCL
ncbi:MAG: hypothetical protein EGS37_05380 [Ruthenibacterium lactatiformans]|nr:hypothetical protein [Ruthenibacterium lactatiformans]